MHYENENMWCMGVLKMNAMKWEIQGLEDFTSEKYDNLKLLRFMSYFLKYSIWEKIKNIKNHKSFRSTNIHYLSSKMIINNQKCN